MSTGQKIWTIHDSPIGPLTLIAGSNGITNLYFSGRPPRLSPAGRRAMPDALAQLDEYFAGERRGFELDLELQGGRLQTQLWDQLLQIPYGSTISYGEIAARIDDALYDPAVESYMRARVIGAAIAANSVPILVPCHRVIGADGSLTGYRGGLARKRALLNLERPGAGIASTGASGEDHQLAML
jgi:methylated-DNA-[protein]-cysteine S-methyltransferase